MDSSKVLLFGLIVLYAVSVAVASLSDFVGKSSNGKRNEYLDSNGKYFLEWEAFSDTQTIIFELSVATTGYVGFGISAIGGMSGADIIIGGVYSNGTVYFSNRHGVGNQMPVVDDSETWELLDASENGTHTILKVGRQWNTCDSQDVAINNSTNNFIWSFGQDDDIAYHQDNRGTSANNILDPAMPPVDTTNFQFWRMTKTMVMPTKGTTYWCTVHKSPPLTTKHHVVGFGPVLETPEALRYTHHFIVHKCRAPVGSTDEETFERFLGQPGADCYVDSSVVPTEYCQSYLFVWAVGGKSVTFPEHVGYPFAIDGESSYYLLEVHFDNPNNIEGVTFESGVDIFYSSELRQYDAGLIRSGHSTSWAITIPPKAEEYVIVGHCSPTCSSNIPPTGVNVFNVLLHSHLAGRKLKIRHYRNGEELPWLSSDDNYDFNYQQNRPLSEEVKLLPGDQLSYECTYNSMNANGAIIGGLSTTDEMCNAFIWYYPEMDLDVCTSEFHIRELVKDFGIEAVQEGDRDPIVLAPESMAGKTYTEVLNTIIPWTIENRDHLQQEIRYGDHRVSCGMAGTYIPHNDTIKYPNITREYSPIDECVDKCAGLSADECADSSSNEQYPLYLMACILAMLPLIPWFS